MMDEQAWRLDELREEARYRRERASEGASARLRRAEAQLSSSSAERLGDS
jgi:hypothetical protein